MKLATLRRGGRDGRLVIVSRDLSRCLPVPASPPRCRRRSTTGRRSRRGSPSAPPRWKPARRCRERCPSISLNAPRRCRAPITGWTAAPTSITWSWCARRAARKCRPRSGPTRWSTRAARTTCWALATTCPSRDEAWGIDLEAEIAVITDDVPMGTGADAAAGAHQTTHAGQRLVAAQPDPRRARQGLRLLPVQARDLLRAGRGHSRRARRRRGATARCTCRSSAASMAWTSAGPTRAST